jgi:P-type Ca2+ transporter type 2C
VSTPWVMTFLNIISAISDYKQSLQFQNLNKEKQNIRLEVETSSISYYWFLSCVFFWWYQCCFVNDVTQVVRGGRRIKVSIYDLVVGDVVPLKIGDQVINGHQASFWIKYVPAISKDANIFCLPGPCWWDPHQRSLTFHRWIQHDRGE